MRDAAESAALAARADPESAVTMVPAFIGLGAPHWDAEARSAIFGLTDGLTLPGGRSPAECFAPRIDAPAREAALAHWPDAVARTRSDGGGANIRTDDPPPSALSARYPSGGNT